MTQVFSRPTFATHPEELGADRFDARADEGKDAGGTTPDRDEPSSTSDRFSAEVSVGRFTPGTRIGTPEGPRPIETLRAGERVTTREGVHRVLQLDLRSIPREDWTYRRAVWPVRVPVGSLGNPVPLRLASDQHVWLAGPTLKRELGCAGVWVALDWLIGLRGLAWERPLGALRQYALTLDGAGGAQVEGVWCGDAMPGAEGFGRDRLRAVFQLMNAAGEPPIAS